MPNIEAIFFDLGDTLTDLREPVPASPAGPGGRGEYMARVVARAGRIYDLLAEAGLAPPDREAFAEKLAQASEARYQEALAEQRGIDIYEVLRWFFAREAIPTRDGLVDAAGALYCSGGGSPSKATAHSRAPLRLGALEMLAALQARGLRLGVISNTLQPARFMDDHLAHNGLLAFFPARVYSSELRLAKPHPAIFRAALDALGVAPGRAVMVGDRLEADIAGAQGVGMKAVLIEVAHRPEQSAAITPDARIRELPELLEALDRLPSE
jgi:HAD superfamily hydrolase (TIGR01509 family)